MIKAFSISDSECTADDINLIGTIVVVYLIQVYDVAHTMHQIYKKWNKRLFKEMYDSFKQGSPIDGWYEGE